MNKTLCLSLYTLALVSFSAGAASTPEEYSKEVTDIVTHQQWIVHDNEAAPRPDSPRHEEKIFKNLPADVAKELNGYQEIIPARPFLACDGTRVYWATPDGKYVSSTGYRGISVEDFKDAPETIVGSPEFKQRLEKACANPNDPLTTELDYVPKNLRNLK